MLGDGETSWLQTPEFSQRAVKTVSNIDRAGRGNPGRPPRTTSQPLYATKHTVGVGVEGVNDLQDGCGNSINEPREAKGGSAFGVRMATSWMKMSEYDEYAGSGGLAGPESTLRES